MSNNRASEIKKEDKKAFKGFIIITMISAFIGFLFGLGSSRLKELFGENIPKLFMNILSAITPFASLVLSLIVIAIYIYVYNKSIKEYEICIEEEENDYAIDKIERNLSIVISITTINNIIGFFFFGISIMILPFDDAKGNLSVIKGVSSFLGFILCTVSTILIQKNIINLEKRINPLLKGSIYEVKFVDKWVDSCDEAIKLGIFKSSYKAYKAVSLTCAILWIFCIVGYDIWGFGIMPMVIVIVIWLVQTIAYSKEAIKSNIRK